MTPNITKMRLAGSACLMAMMAMSVPAYAADAAPAPAPAATDGGDDGSGVAEIIVSARRRNESIQSTPIAMTAITPAALESKATLNIGDLMGAAPSLLISQQNSGGAAANLSIRGLTYADVEKSQEPTVGVVVDGVFIGTNTGQYLDFFDIGQIEILRGPQGTLFGRNTIGGVINIKRTRPTGEFGVKAEFSYGSYATWSGKAVVNAPIVQDKLAAKLFYFHSASDGYYTNAFTGKHVGGNKNDNYGLSLLATPTDDFDALLTLERQVQNFDVVNANISRTGELFCLFEPSNQCNRNSTTDLYTVFNSPGHSNYRSPAATLEMNWQLGGVKITSVTGYRESKENQTQDFDASSIDLYYAHRQQKYHQTSQEIRAAGNIFDGLDYVVGGYYFDSKYNLIQHTGSNAANVDLDPNAQLVEGKNRSIAGFGDFDWKFADHWRLSFGGRYTHDKKSLRNAFVTSGLVGDGMATFNKFTPKVGVDYRPNEEIMVYGSWSRGYRSGGFSPRAATAATGGTPYGPETVDSYEVGTKLSLLDRKLLLNVAAFYADYQKLQQNTTIPGGPTGNQTITANVGSAKIKGLEFDFTARPTHELTLNGALGLLRSHFKGFIAGNVPTYLPPGSMTTGVPSTNPINYDYSDNNLIYAPKTTASLNAEYSRDVGFADWKLNFGYRYLAAYDLQISLGALTGNAATGPLTVNGNDPRVRAKAQNLIDASTSFIFKVANTKTRVTVYGRNLTDDRGINTGLTVAGLFSFASAREPRTYGVQVGFEF